MKGSSDYKGLKMVVDGGFHQVKGAIYGTPVQYFMTSDSLGGE